MALMQQEDKPRIDPYIVMEDIIEKLRLLNYETNYCRKFKKEIISKYYFACSNVVGSKPNTPSMNNIANTANPNISQFIYFFELSNWLLSLINQVTNLLDISLER